MPAEVETDSGNLDKFVHMILFGVFAYLVAMNIKNKPTSSSNILTAFVASCIYAYLAEIIQLFIPGRDYSLFDFAAGISGAIIFLIIFYVRNRK